MKMSSIDAPPALYNTVLLPESPFAMIDGCHLYIHGLTNPDGRTDRQKAMHKNPQCMSTGGLKYALVLQPGGATVV